MNKCAICKVPLPKMSFWESIASIAEYRINYPNDPKMKLPKDITCDVCHREYMKWHNQLTPEKRKELDKKAKEDFENEIKGA